MGQPLLRVDLKCCKVLQKDPGARQRLCWGKCTVIQEGGGGETDRQPSRALTYLQTDKQMAGKWVDGHKGKESSSQTDRKTDGKLIGRQTGGQNDKWDTASQTDYGERRRRDRQGVSLISCVQIKLWHCCANMMCLCLFHCRWSMKSSNHWLIYSF